MRHDREKIFELRKQGKSYREIQNLDTSLCTQKWLFELNISEENLYKPQIIQGKLKTRKLHFGVGTTIIISSFLKRKLLFWIEQAKLYLI